jgi:uncharacterized protein YndB with AHSA1/START domain
MAAPSTLSTTFTTPSDRELVATRVFDAPPSRIWDAHTRPEHVKQWMLGPEGTTMPIAEMEVRPRGTWHYVWRNPDGSEIEMNGLYREIVPGERLVQTENWGGDWPETVHTLELTERDGKTTARTTVVYPSKQARDAALGTGMREGWSESYDRLDRYLRSIP